MTAIMSLLSTLARRAPSGLLAIGLLFVGTTASARTPPAPTTSIATPALWQVKDDDTTIYLFGTVHVLKPGIDWFKGDVRAAFDRSDELVLEIIEPDDPKAMAGTMASMAMAKDGMKLSDRLSPEARTAYQAAMQANGLPWQHFEIFNPWMAGMILSVAPLERLGYRSDLGAEKLLRASAVESGKTVDALETIEQQIGFFASLPMPQQLAFLNSTVEELPELQSQFDTLLGHWQAGKPEMLAEEMNESLAATPELAKLLLTDRNANWARWIKARMERPGTVFLAVGAGHLAGKDSVQDQLKAIGIASERLKD